MDISLLFRREPFPSFLSLTCAVLNYKFVRPNKYYYLRSGVPNIGKGGCPRVGSVYLRLVVKYAGNGMVTNRFDGTFDGTLFSLNIN